MAVSGGLNTKKKPDANMWTTNAAHVRQIFPSTMAMNRLFQILRANRFNDKIASHKRRPTDNSAPVIDVLESITQDCIFTIVENVFENFS
jgi:hypothetical protein